MKQLLQHIKIVVGVGYITLLLAAIVSKNWLIVALIVLLIIDNIIYNLERN